ncbi:MAG: ThiF family adenylyltransferase [Promethearchaeota archaeon]|jgi:hypothetical protein
MARVHSYLQHESLYRGVKIVQKRHDARIMICGVGALGSWLIDLLARQGYWNLTALDMGKVGDENFGTQNYGKMDVGRFKAKQIAANVFRRISVPISVITKKLCTNNAAVLLKNQTLVVDLFDNRPGRMAVQQICSHHRWPCVHAGLAAMGFFQVHWNEGYVVPSARNEDASDAPCEYPLAANLVIMCVAATAEVINRYIDDNQKLNVEFWLNSLSLDCEV